MEQYEFNLDKDNLEIFPEEIWKNPNIVFHGTSEYHSQQIERDGFIPCTSPFNLDDARELVRVLEIPEIAVFDVPKTFEITVARTLNSYIFGIENNDFRLSFAYLSYLCAYFSIGNLKGGQTFGNIREAKRIINQAIQTNKSLEQYITEPIKRLFQLERDVANSNGVVYAIKLELPYNGITEEYGTIHSTATINPDNIIAKIVLPNDINLHELNILKTKNNTKLLKPGNLGVILKRMILEEEDKEDEV